MASLCGRVEMKMTSTECKGICTGTRCHCQMCGEPGRWLNQDGYCLSCLEGKDLEAAKEQLFIVALKACTSWHLVRMQLLNKLGVKHSSNKIDPACSFTKELDGVKYRMFSAAEKTSLTRLYVCCPMCYREISVGRLHQHAKTHKWARNMINRYMYEAWSEACKQ